MKKETIFCDLCGYEFTGQENWAASPCGLTFSLASPPRQKYESSHYDHLCWTCVESIKESFITALNERIDSKSKT